VTGLIYVGIIAVWAVVLVPAWLRRHDHRDPERSVDRFSRSLQALSQRDSLLGIPLPDVDESDVGRQRAEAAPEVLRVRREDVAAMRQRVTGMIPRPAATSSSRARAARTAAARRRVVLAVLGAGLAVVAGLVVGGILLPVALVVPVGLIGAFVAVARHQVRTAQQRRAAAGATQPVRQPVAVREQHRAEAASGSAGTWEARPTTLPTYVTAPPAAEFPRVIDTATPGAWTAAAMLERAQQQKARAERMAAAKAEAIARAKAEQAAAEARSRDEEFLAAQAAAWAAQDTSAPAFRPRAVNE
jgi:hypothetical protein